MEGIKRKVQLAEYDGGDLPPGGAASFAGTTRTFGRRGGFVAGAAAFASLLIVLVLSPKLLHVMQLHAAPLEQVQLAQVPASKTQGSPTQTPRECGRLSKELLQQYAKDGMVMIAFTDHLMFKLFGRTWLHHVRTSGITYWILAVPDQKTAQMVLSSGATQCFMAEEVEVDNLQAEFQWGSRTWLLHTWQKVLTVRHVHHLGFNVIQSDMDVVWFRDPAPYFLQKYTEPDYFVSMDPITTQNPLGDDGPELGVTVHHYMNTGVYFLRNTSGGSALIDKWYEIRKESQAQGYHDQDGLYKYLTLKDKEQVDRKNRYTKVVDGRTKLAQMPATQFQNGYSHCVNKVHKVHNLQPYETHFVWVYGNNNGKMHRMREAMYFQDEEAYYAAGGTGSHVVVTDQSKGPLHSSFPLSGSAKAESSGKAGFMSVDLQTIQTPVGFNSWSDVLLDTENMTRHHLSSLQAQLTEVYHAVALAHVLNRTLILPKIQCWCIQNWFENPLCRLPGELHTQFPMDCPADYVFNMNKLYSIEIQGQRVPIREYSFLDNPNTPSAVKAGDLSISLIKSSLPTDPVYDQQQHTLQLTVGPSLSELSRALAPYQERYKRLHFKAPLTHLGDTRFGDQGLQAAFDEAMSLLPVKWCCRPDVVLKATGLRNDHQLIMARTTPDSI